MTTTLEVRVTDAEVDDAVFRKVFRRLMWFLFLLLVVSFTDRINIGFAALTMNKDLGFNSAAYGMSLTVFYVAYVLCEIPSNLVLARVGARLWMARIMITWGIASAATMFAVGMWSLYGIRALVGVAEAGFPTWHAPLPDLLVSWLLSGPRQRALHDGDSSDHRHCLEHLRLHSAYGGLPRFGRLALVISARRPTGRRSGSRLPLLPR